MSIAKKLTYRQTVELAVTKAGSLRDYLDICRYHLHRVERTVFNTSFIAGALKRMERVLGEESRRLIPYHD